MLSLLAWSPALVGNNISGDTKCVLQTVARALLDGAACKDVAAPENTRNQSVGTPGTLCKWALSGTRQPKVRYVLNTAVKSSDIQEKKERKNENRRTRGNKKDRKKK